MKQPCVIASWPSVPVEIVRAAGFRAVIARGTSEELKFQVGGERLEMSVKTAADTEAAAQVLAGVGTGEVRVDKEARSLAIAVNNGAESLIQVIRALDEAGITPLDVALHRPTLDDVFMTLTGRAAEEVAS